MFRVGVNEGVPLDRERTLEAGDGTSEEFTDLEGVERDLRSSRF